VTETRILNWQLVVPDEDAPMLLLPAGDETVPGATVVAPDPRSLDAALAPGSYHGVVAPDLGAWEGEFDGGVASLLSRLAATPGPGGWLFAAFANRRFPRRTRRKHGLRLGRALKMLRAAGFDDVAVYIPLPSHRQPAWLVPVERRAELDVFLRQMVFPYAPVSSRLLSWFGSRAIQAGRRIALGAPHGLRVRFAPSYAIVARRAA
jgi:hypothetical protein